MPHELPNDLRIKILTTRHPTAFSPMGGSVPTQEEKKKELRS